MRDYSAYQAITYTKEGKNIIIEDVRLFDKTPIFDEKLYKIASTSFLLHEQKDENLQKENHSPTEDSESTGNGKYY